MSLTSIFFTALAEGVVNAAIQYASQSDDVASKKDKYGWDKK